MGKKYKFRNRNGPNYHRKNRSQQNPNDPAKHTREYIPRINLKENQVGITEFVSKSDGFTGIFKARFSDFHVNEIDKEGNVIVLTNQIAPKLATELSPVKLENNKKDLELILTKDVWSQIDQMLTGCDLTVSVDIEVTTLEKDKRGTVHKTLKEIYGNKIITTTEIVNDKKFISCSKSKSGKGDGRTRWRWDGEFVYFVVHKENTDTVQAASDIATALHMTPSAVNYAGTKDKRAKTTQRFCVKKREPEHILRSVRRFPYLKVGNFEFKNQVLKLGDLSGNRFKIALRHVDGDDGKINESLENMKANGFINYYGLQRFGNCSTIPTHQVGIALLKSDYKEATELILKPRDGEMFFLKEARETWWKNRNSAEAAAMITNHKFIEKKLLDGLARFGENDYASALKRIPRNMLLLYTHAFQSFIWNRIASKRIAQFGLDLIVGDLVFREESEDDEISPDEIIDRLEDIGTTESENLDEEINNKLSEEEEESLEKSLSIYKQKVRPLTQHDLDNKKYTIFDILLPLPGYDISYPENEMKNWYIDLLSEYDLTSEKLKHNVKTYALTGAYRKILIKPENMSWEFKRYDSPTSVLIASDYDIMQSKCADSNIENGVFKALLLEFSLPAAAYATMALREILKADTSSMNQALLEKNEMNKFEVAQSQQQCCDGDQEETEQAAASIKRKAEEDETVAGADDADNNVENKIMKFDPTTTV